ncbi:SCO0607 family lipoprotein [Streptomyces sp. NPDC058295]|uniref:SCO0607 family lipoprotein n=1 Tax=Streptomyces sp. NPDC058295 TaxID=3346431 RepID=UPI0036E39266
MRRTRSRGRARSAVAGVVGAAVAVAVAVATLTGCGLQIEEASCGGGEYPVLAVNSGGGDCVPDGEEPAQGWARYPEGKVPEKVGDKWDTYWSTHTLDEKGEIIELPEGE